MQHSHASGVSRDPAREPRFQQSHSNGIGQYAAPPPGFQQLSRPAQGLNAQAQPYQPGVLTWQQRQQQEQYREPRPARRRQTPTGLQTPGHSQPPRRHRPDQNNASRANVRDRGTGKPVQQGGRKNVDELPGRLAADDTVSSAEEKLKYPSCSICYEDCKVRPLHHTSSLQVVPSQKSLGELMLIPKNIFRPNFWERGLPRDNRAAH